MPRELKKEVTINGPVSEVWRLWTTEQGITSFFAPQAKVELKVGGFFEMYFMPDQPYGSRGAEGCRILEFEPEKSLSFSWNAPPSIPALRDAGEMTRVDLEFTPVDGRTHVAFRQHELGEGADWDAYYDYFDNAWSYVLSNLRQHFDKA